MQGAEEECGNRTNYFRWVMGIGCVARYCPIMRQLRYAVMICLCALNAAAAQKSERRGDDQPIPVRHTEGTVHGFLDLHTAGGEFLAHGDLTQVGRNGAIESRMIFRFPDGSLFEEMVAFTQKGVFAMESYHLVQRGPAFEGDLDATLSKSGAWTVKTKSHDRGETKETSGTLRMPGDVSDGMITMLLKNLAPGESQTVHVVAFTPAPRMIELVMQPVGTEKVAFGKSSESATRYNLKPRLGKVTGFFAKVAGKLPPDSQTWIVTDEVPAFVRFQGPLFTGPVWRI